MWAIHKECQVALRKNELLFYKALIWLHTCGVYLRELMIIPTVSSVVLAAEPQSGALNTLFVAGTFYASHGQLYVVSPPGLSSGGQERKEYA